MIFIFEIKVFNPMNAQLKITIVMCRFDHGFSFEHMSNRFDIGASTI
jgi:hypothetical protein